MLNDAPPTHGELHEQLRAAIDAELKRGTPLEQIRIRYGGHEWRWSKLLRRWDLYDPALVKDLTNEEDE